MSCARRWLQDCEGRHANCCVRVSISRLPSRLIQIDKPGYDQVRLVDAATICGDTIRYATLSHCWGSSTVFNLTSATKAKLSQGIPTSELGLTFRDAVKVAREMGVLLIWIDSLCIVQDSKHDWQNEAPKMSDVYRGAVVNIAAMSGANTEAGCLPKNVHHEVEPLIVTLQQTEVPSGKYILYNHRYAASSFEGMPLLKRGWVVQELILAPRLLYLCATEMFWQCREVLASETYPDGIPPTPRHYAPWIPRETIWKALNGPHTAKLPRPDAPKELLWEIWREVIEIYTKCSLTFVGDKLVAVSGLAKSIQAAFNIDYCAGLWDWDLEYQLLWGGASSQPRYPPPSYRAPTWSWASMDGYISMSRYQEERERWLLVARIVDKYVETQTSDTTAHILGAYIRLSGWLATIRIRRDDGPQMNWDVFANGAWSKDSHGHYLGLDSDVPTDQVHALAVLVDKAEDQPAAAVFLLLQPTGVGKGQFYKIGTLYATLETLGIGGRDYNALGKMENEPWLEFESEDEPGTCTFTII